MCAISIPLEDAVHRPYISMLAETYVELDEYLI